MTVHRVYASGQLDLDQFASVLGRLLELVDEPKSAGVEERFRPAISGHGRLAFPSPRSDQCVSGGSYPMNRQLGWGGVR
jgi:hypothetical protein